METIETSLITDIIFGIIMLILLVCSATFSGSETAYFALSPKQLENLREEGHNYCIKLIEQPERLLATILIANNFANVGIVTISSYLAARIFTFENQVVVFLLQVVLVTFLILLFGEILPKLFANRARLTIAKLTSKPMYGLMVLFSPFSSMLIKSTSIISNRMRNKQVISMDEVSKAIELTEEEEIDEEKEILEGIVRFTSITTSDILTPRIDVIALDKELHFSQVKEKIIIHGYSRMPIYEENLDTICGILYVKDLLPYLKENDSFKWDQLMRPAYFVPENKKINTLLEEFQEKKVHMAIVVDEYGGTTGIVTMEDILEEILGEINDEYDETDCEYVKTKNNAYIFKAATLLNDFSKIIGIEDDEFEEVCGEAETLAGLILEIKGEMPKQGESVIYGHHKFTVTEANNRRISKIKYETLNQATKSR